MKDNDKNITYLPYRPMEIGDHAFALTDTGAHFWQRMVKDHEDAETAAEAVIQETTALQ